jgi:hypothetical protein
MAFYLGFAGNITPRGEEHIAREPQVEWSALPVHVSKTHTLCKDAALSCISKEDDDKLTSISLLFRLQTDTHIH